MDASGEGYVMLCEFFKCIDDIPISMDRLGYIALFAVLYFLFLFLISSFEPKSTRHHGSNPVANIVIAAGLSGVTVLATAGLFWAMVNTPVGLFSFLAFIALTVFIGKLGSKVNERRRM
ncbi:MAG: hypothetical protein ACYSR0_00445 [Planctomycetota bacterium]|jgi:hypothetical protein